jgi:hypothetical protein
VLLVIGWQAKGSKAFSTFKAAMDSTVAAQKALTDPGPNHMWCPTLDAESSEPVRT